ncbi:MAG: type II toxin-antitoxin system YafQ family toxin [Sutterellaceae bacterium]|nr:type II toxin-antitoxin system YafQ family toxin [Sutterellaceae bacterium]MDD7441406.1 type II toxin-antitoxin system YafQ family toxin [Sutterellaceae bacterium]MDY2869044.1 type II toxin-antitoxin system YafQ family toxin [Mesosutterella sp.]
MRDIRPTGQFRKDLKLIRKRGYDLRLLEEVLRMLAEDVPLPPKYRDHSLAGKFSGSRECHISPDWLLIYEKYNSNLYLYLLRTGTHSDLF